MSQDSELDIPQSALDRIENQARINDLADEAKAARGRSLKEKLARMAIGWAGPSRYSTNPAAAALRYTGNDSRGNSEYAAPEVPKVDDGGHYVGDVFAPAQPGIARADHERVIREWIAEEELSEALHAGGAFDAVLKAAKTMTARRILKVMESVAEDMRIEGDVLWVGKRTRAAVGDALIKQVKPELMEAIRDKETTTTGAVLGVRAADRPAEGGTAAAAANPGTPDLPPPG